MKNFNFELEEKLDHHFQVKFDGESDGDSPEVQKPYLIFRPLNWPLLTPNRPKMKILHFELEEKLDQHF